jgi:cyclase
VKGIHFEGLRVLGKPETFARFYYESGADELIYMDTVASLYGRNSLLDIVERTSREIFIPLTVGGGLRSIEDIRKVLRAGADKVALNTAAIARPELIREASETFGASTVVISIEAIRTSPGHYEAFANYGRESTGVDAVEWASRAVGLGAGEVMVTSINQDGTGKGFDLELVRRIAESSAVPGIVGGGAGRLEDLPGVFIEGKADAVALASVLHYDCLERAPNIDQDFKDEGNVEFLMKGGRFRPVKPASLQEIKAYLTAQGVDCRLPGIRNQHAS